MPRLKLLFVLVGCFCVSAASQQVRRTFTVRDLFAEPGLTGFAPEAIQWSPDGRRLSFLERHTGSELSDLFVIDAATGGRTVLVTGDVLAGAAEPLSKIKDERERERRSRYAVASYHWSPKGDALLYANGDQLYLYNPQTRQSRQLTREPGDKHDPKLSPDERWVSYVLDGDLHLAPLEGADPQAIAPHQEQILNGDMDWVYPEELELRSGYEWSPDSSRIAFMQFDEHPVHDFPLVDYTPHFPAVDAEKYPKAGDPNPIVRFGVYSVATRQTTWIPVAGTPDSYLFRIGWLPGSNSVYALVLNRAQTRIELWVADAATGQPRLVLSESNAYWIGVNTDFRFLEGGKRFIWGSDRDGWHHLYLFDAAGELLRQLTRGAWHVSGVSDVDEANGWVYYMADQRSPLGRDLYRVALKGGEPQLLTREPGTHDATFSPDHRHYLDHFSAALQPPSLTLRSVDQPAGFVVHPARDLSGYQLETPEFLTLTSADGHTPLHAQLIRPAGFNPRHKYPVIMYQYGGPGTEEGNSQAVRDAWGGVRFLFDELLANQGFAILVVDNRAAQCYSFPQQAQIKGRFGRVELEDQLAAARWIKAQPWVDAARVGIWGWSYGGYMTTYELGHAPGVWRAAIAVAPVTEWTDYDTIYTERYMGLPQQNQQGYHDSSSVNYADRIQDPLLLVHGTGDDNVHFQNSVQFIDRMIEYGKPFELMIYPRKTHGIAGAAAGTHLFSLMEQFWLRQLAEK